MRGTEEELQRNQIAPPKLHRRAIGNANEQLGLVSMVRYIAGAIAAGFDGLTDASLPEAETAATRRLDWRRALENMADELKRLFVWSCDQLRSIQRGGGEMGGIRDGSSGEEL